MEVYEGEKIFVELLNPKDLKICPALISPRGAGGNNSKPTLSVQGNTVRLDFFTSTTCDLKISAGPKNDELFRFYHFFIFFIVHVTGTKLPLDSSAENHKFTPSSFLRPKKQQKFWKKRKK